MQTGVGHYGVFNGKRWERQIYPRVRSMIHDNEPRAVVVSARAQPIQLAASALVSPPPGSAPAAPAAEAASTATQASASIKPATGDDAPATAKVVPLRRNAASQ